MLDIYFIIKIVLAALGLSVAGMFLLRRISSDKTNGQSLKHNISLIRKEKLLIHTDKKLEKKRQRLLKKSRSFRNKSQSDLINKSKKLGISTGEMILASKIQMNLD